MDSGMFLPLQIGAVEALNNPPKWFSDLNEIYRERQEVVFKILEKLNCTFKKEQGGMFVWAKIPSNYNDGYALSDKILYERNVFLTPGGIFGSQGNKFIRISLCNKIEVLEKSLERIN